MKKGRICDCNHSASYHQKHNFYHDGKFINHMYFECCMDGCNCKMFQEVIIIAAH